MKSKQFKKNILLKENLDLNNIDSIINWLYKHGPEEIFDYDSNINWNYKDTITGDDLETLINQYIEIYNNTIKYNKIKVYRMLILKSIFEINFKNLGIYWSFDINNVGDYGLKFKRTINDKSFILTAVINTKDIDWENGFFSYLLYGSSQKECYLKKGSICYITEINEKKLERPIKGIC